ncbi:hypothetical protein HMPREF1979_02189 [Actinomyces johnsonii F0542]|uniref:Uncharacterized protein n=1 Tax=Actinomyces johnsonii F0542 TaxID=1321818 RepID=U1QM23_9ACTO|nr:hypothetical protein HMPREF1979_02189 [Actinomyces johnsonii F0542]
MGRYGHGGCRMMAGWASGSGVMISGAGRRSHAGGDLIAQGMTGS